MTARMNKIGINLMVWRGEITPDLFDRLPLIKRWGYDGVEIPIFNPAASKTAEIRVAVEAAGLVCTVSTALPAGHSLIDPERQREAVDWLRQVIEAASNLGSSVVCGPLAVPVGELPGRGFDEAEWSAGVTALKELGQIATDEGLTLALEPLNRFETFFVNTVADAVKLMDAVKQPSVGLLLDTFHMNIEEKSIVAAIRQAGPHLKHFHCSENDRGIVGSGHIPWPEILMTLREVGYDGWLTVESFGATIPELAAAACVWRPLAPSPEILAEESVRFIRQHRM